MSFFRTISMSKDKNVRLGHNFNNLKLNLRQTTSQNGMDIRPVAKFNCDTRYMPIPLGLLTKLHRAEGAYERFEMSVEDILSYSNENFDENGIIKDKDKPYIEKTLKQIESYKEELKEKIIRLQNKKMSECPKELQGLQQQMQALTVLYNAIKDVLTTKDFLDRKCDFSLMEKKLSFLLSQNLADFSKKTMIEIFRSPDIDFVKNLRELEKIVSNKSEIFSSLEETPLATSIYKDFIKEYLKTPQKRTQLLLIDNLSEKYLRETMLIIAKIIDNVYSNPKNYIAEAIEMSDDEISLYQKFCNCFKYMTAENNYTVAGWNTSKFFEALQNGNEEKYDELYSAYTNDNGQNLIDTMFRNSDYTRVIDSVVIVYEFFLENLHFFANTLHVLDKDAMQQIAEKGTYYLINTTYDIFNLKPEISAELSNLVKNARVSNKKGEYIPLPCDKKIAMMALLSAWFPFEENDFDIHKYILNTPQTTQTQQRRKKLKHNQFEFDFKKFEQDTMKRILMSFGVDSSCFDSRTSPVYDWDINYIHTLVLRSKEKNPHLANLVVAASEGRFSDLITNEENIYSRANAATKKTFLENNLNYQNWLTGIPQKKYNLADTTISIKLWDRIPQDSLFDGSYTSCCTSIDGGNGHHMATYMLNTAINVIEVKNKNGDVIGMSRCFIANINGQKALVLDTIEINNNFKKQYLKDLQEQRTLAEHIFSYAKDFAQSVGGKDLPVYLSSKYVKLALPEMKKEAYTLSLLGLVASKDIYINAICEEINPTRKFRAKLYTIKEPKLGIDNTSAKDIGNLFRQSYKNVNPTNIQRIV